MKKMLLISLFATAGLISCSDTEFTNDTGVSSNGSNNSSDSGDTNVVDRDGKGFRGGGIDGLGNDRGSLETAPCKGVMDLAGVTKFEPNLVPNGDFEKDENFSSTVDSNYNYDDLSQCTKGGDSLLPHIGSFSIAVNPNACHRHWDVLSDTKIAIFNGATAGHFFCKTFNVEKGKSYAFAVSERLLHPTSDGSSPLRWEINGKQIISALSPVQEWKTRGAIWKSGESGSAVVCGLNESPQDSGNDWAIDNICLVPQ